MRANKTTNWTRFLPKIVENMNNTVNYAIGNIKPIGSSMILHVLIIHITVFFPLPDVQDKDGDSIIINQLKKVHRFVKTRSVEEQSQALKKYLKNSSSKHFRPGDLVMKDIDTDGKQLEEKGYSLKVSFRINVFMTF